MNLRYIRMSVITIEEAIFAIILKVDHIIKYNSENEQYNINFIHFIINEKRLVVAGADMWSLLIIPYEIALITTFLSIANDNKLQEGITIGGI